MKNLVGDISVDCVLAEEEVGEREEDNKGSDGESLCSQDEPVLEGTKCFVLLHLPCRFGLLVELCFLDSFPMMELSSIKSCISKRSNTPRFAPLIHVSNMHWFNLKLNLVII